MCVRIIKIKIILMMQFILVLIGIVSAANPGTVACTDASFNT
jgi:hypothetical protein